MLESLERANLFLVPLDDRRRWYRYHHLFADLLRARLLDQHPGRRARAPSPGERLVGGARRARGGDRARARRGRRRPCGRTSSSRRPGGCCGAGRRRPLRRWLDALPDRVFDVRPVLADAHAGTLLVSGRSRGRRPAPRPRPSAGWTRPATPADAGSAALEADGHGRATDLEGARAGCPAPSRSIGAALAWMQGDLPGRDRPRPAGAGRPRAAMDVEAGGAAGILGPRALDDGRPRRGARGVVRGRRGARSRPATTRTSSAAPSRSATSRSRRAGCTTPGGPTSGACACRPPTDSRRSGAPPTCTSASPSCACEWNDLDGGPAGTSTQAAALGEAHGPAAAPVPVAGGARRRCSGWRATPTRRSRCSTRRSGSTTATSSPRSTRSPRRAPGCGPRPAGMPTRWRGRASAGSRPTTSPSYLREDEHITLARALLAEAAADGQPLGGDAGVRRSSAGCSAAAEAGGRGRSVVELLVLRALARHGPRATVTARPPRWTVRSRWPSPRATCACSSTRGAPMAELLAGGRAPVARVVCEPPARRAAHERPRRSSPRGPRQPLVEPLSERELEVLRLLASDLDGPEIAAELIVSLNTMRTHTKNIFAKLGVNSRRAAVTRGRPSSGCSRGTADRRLRRADPGASSAPESPPRSPPVVMPAHHAGPERSLQDRRSTTQRSSHSKGA